MASQLSNLSGAVDLPPEWRMMVTMARAYTRDFGKLNLLLGGNEETDDKTILMCLQLAVIDVNSMPPCTAFDLPTLVGKGYVTLLLYGLMVHLLEGLMLLETRNRLTWQEGGTLIGLQDKTPLLDSHLKYFKDSFTVSLKQKKIADSISECMDPNLIGVHSEYYYINGFLWNVSP